MKTGGMDMGQSMAWHRTDAKKRFGEDGGCG